MRSFDVQRLALPALGFAVLLGLALVVTSRSARRPGADLYRAARAYLSALRQGDLEVVAARHRGALGPDDLRAFEQRRGWLGQITAVRTSESGREGEVGVLWVDARGAPVGTVRILWVRDARRGWLVERTAIEAPPLRRGDAGAPSRRFQG